MYNIWLRNLENEHAVAKSNCGYLYVLFQNNRSYIIITIIIIIIIITTKNLRLMVARDAPSYYPSSLVLSLTPNTSLEYYMGRSLKAYSINVKLDLLLSTLTF